MSTPPAAPALPPDEALDAARALDLGRELGLTADEVDRIVDTLGRVPSVSELGMYSVMWSEHCSYKSSRRHLRTLPTTGPQVLVGPGENAGVVDVGDGLAVTFKIESHNHPSFVEPYQGAATGVGGILRDILTMGARPIAVMDPLRLGDPGGWVDGAGTLRPVDHRQRHLIDGVVRGVGGYGNCVGVPNIGGETVLDEAYAGNPLVNVLAIGVLAHDRLQRARAEEPGDLAVLVGSATGRDGIGGASVLASQQFDEGLDAKRPNVQVGDPFAEKLLIECCLELYDRGLVRGIQDMGAAGIACSTSELASAASMGMRIDLDRVHLRLAREKNVPLGVIPAGTGNDLARHLGLPLGSISQATERLITAMGGDPRQIDLGIARSKAGIEHPFACVFSAGFDALVNERANSLRFPKGRHRYTLALLIELAKLRPIPYTLTLDGVEETGSYLLVAVANSQSFGGGMKVTPDASLVDGKLDVFTLDPLSRLAFLRIYPRVFKGLHVTDHRVHIRQARSVRVESPGVVAYADGERLEALPLEVTVEPMRVSVFA